MVAGVDAIERLRVVGDEACEDVDPAGRALGVRRSGNAAGKIRTFEQRYDVDASGFQDGAIGEIDLVHEDREELFPHRRARAGKKARANPVCDGAEAQVDARRLQLRLEDVLRGDDLAPGANQAAQDVARQNSGRVAAVEVGLRAGAKETLIRLGHGGFVLPPMSSVQRCSLRNPRISAIASASPQRRTGASLGNAVSRRDGVAGSRITKQPLSRSLRMSRPKACFSLRRVSWSS